MASATPPMRPGGEDEEESGGGGLGGLGCGDGLGVDLSHESHGLGVQPDVHLNEGFPRVTPLIQEMPFVVASECVAGHSPSSVLRGTSEDLCCKYILFSSVDDAFQYT